MAEEKQSTSVPVIGIGFPGALFIAFLVLKLCGVIDWSWWWVFAPLWIPFALTASIVIVILLVVFVIMGVIGLVAVFTSRK